MHKSGDSDNDVAMNIGDVVEDRFWRNGFSWNGFSWNRFWRNGFSWNGYFLLGMLLTICKITTLVLQQKSQSVYI